MECGKRPARGFHDRECRMSIILLRRDPEPPKPEPDDGDGGDTPTPEGGAGPTS